MLSLITLLVVLVCNAYTSSSFAQNLQSSLNTQISNTNQQNQQSIEQEQANEAAKDNATGGYINGSQQKQQKHPKPTEFLGKLLNSAKKTLTTAIQQDEGQVANTVSVHNEVSSEVNKTNTKFLSIFNKVLKKK